jgi:membrane associated rhomboid family serine protease
MAIFITEKRHFKNTLLISAGMVLLIILAFVLEKGLGKDFYFLGVHPRSVDGLYGLVTMIFVHADWGHLFNNCFALFLLTAALFYFYGEVAEKIFLFCWIFSGAMLWLIGRSDTWHIGASGLVYALAFFLCISGFLRRYIPLIAISLIVVFLYGSMVWHIFPWQVNDPISWEGHLSGMFVGGLLAVVYRKEGPQRPMKDWHEEDETPEEIALDEYAESFELEGEEKKEEDESL